MIFFLFEVARELVVGKIQCIDLDWALLVSVVSVTYIELRLIKKHNLPVVVEC